MTNTTATKSLGREAALGVNGVTKSQCHCGRRQCSDLRQDQRRTARRTGKAAFRQEVRSRDW